MYKKAATCLMFVLCAVLMSSVDARRLRGNFPAALRDVDFYEEGSPDPAKVQLGQFLFFDKILSGNKNISCATCHHPSTGTGDGLALPVGEGGEGLGIMRSTGTGGNAIQERVPRNAQPLFNLGARAFSVMFHDGRVAVDDSHASGFQSPAGEALPIGLDNVLAAQAMFPVTSANEMAGQPGENPVADAGAASNLAGPGGVWEQLAARLREIDEYVELFRDAYPNIGDSQDITFVHAANAIAAYEATAFRADNSPFDQYLRGKRGAMTASAIRGMVTFYKRNSCASCHAGVLQTDLKFHSVAMPQIGPGKGDGPGGHDDYGREQVTGDPADRCNFRTPSLRNVVLTGPWGHDGAFDSLPAMVEHHLDPVASLYAYEVSEARLPSRDDLDDVDATVMEDGAALAQIAATNDLALRRRALCDLDDLMAFLYALADESSLDLRVEVPGRLPSGLPLADSSTQGRKFCR